MEQLVHGIIDRIRALLNIKTLKTIFGTKRRPFRHSGKKAPRLEHAVERPTYDLIIFKIHFGKLTVKLYTKGERVLRIEVITHHARALSLGCSLPRFSDIARHLKAILERFTTVLHCVDHSFISDQTLDELHTSSQVGKSRVGGINIHQSRIRAVIEAVIALATAPEGFRASDLADQVRQILHCAPDQYTPRQAAYDLKKLRGKGLVCRMGSSRRYQPTVDGLRTMTALFVLREKVIKPVLAGAGKPKRGPKPKHQSHIDTLYQAIQLAMRNLFEALSIAA